MSLRRFNNILRSWHYEDYLAFTEGQLNAFRKEDPFWAVKKFVTALATLFVEVYNPSQRVDIDEQCVPWKGRHTCRCYNPSKPEKWHFKIFALNDATSGYMCNFYLNQGKSERRPN